MLVLSIPEALTTTAAEVRTEKDPWAHLSLPGPLTPTILKDNELLTRNARHEALHTFHYWGKDLPLKEQENVESMLQRADLASLKAFQKIAANPLSQHLTAHEKLELMAVFRSCAALGREALAEISSHSRSGIGEFQERDILGATLISNLSCLMRGTFCPELEPHRLDFMTSLVREIAWPGRVEPAMVHGCAPTEASVYMIETNPSEVVRLLNGLASLEGIVHLSNGECLKRIDGFSVNAVKNHTSLAQALLQTAFNDYADGNALTTSAIDAAHYRVRDGVFDHFGTGDLEMAHLMSGLLGRPVRALRGEELRSYLAQLKSEPPQDLHFIASLRWRVDGVPEDSVAHVTSSRFEGYHAITLLQLDINQHKVKLRNESNSAAPAGKIYLNPPRTVVDAAHHIEVMKLDEFEKRVSCIWIPQKTWSEKLKEAWSMGLELARSYLKIMLR